MRPNSRAEMVRVEADDQVVMLARLKNGATGTIEASKIATGMEDELRFEIHGSKGALRFNLMEPNYLEAYDMRSPESPLGGERGWQRISTVQRYDKPAVFPSPKSGIGWTRGHVHCLYSFLKAVADGSPAEPSLLRGLELQKKLAVIEESAKMQSWRRF
jgi:predicted dehydrogenase